MIIDFSKPVNVSGLFDYRCTLCKSYISFGDYFWQCTCGNVRVRISHHPVDTINYLIIGNFVFSLRDNCIDYQTDHSDNITYLNMYTPWRRFINSSKLNLNTFEKLMALT